MDHRSRVDTVCGRMSRTILASSSLNRHDTSLRFALSIFSPAIFSTTEPCHVVANTSLSPPPHRQLSSLHTISRLLLHFTQYAWRYLNSEEKFLISKWFNPFEFFITNNFFFFKNRSYLNLIVHYLLRARIKFASNFHACE